MNQNSTPKTDLVPIGVRWLAVGVISLVMFSSYYFYDALSTIKPVFTAQFQFSGAEYGAVVGWYSLANIIMAVVGGALLDKWGIRKTGLLFFGISAIGAIVTAYGVSDAYGSGGFGFSIMNGIFPKMSPVLKILLLGRLIFGLGAESSYVVINRVLVKWFKGKQLAFAFGLNLAVARLGTASALVLAPSLTAGPTDIGISMTLAAGIMCLGFLFFIIYSILDYSPGRKLDANVASGEEEKFQISDVFDLFKNKAFIYISMLCVLFYSAVFPFLAFTPDLLFNKFGINLESAGFAAWIGDFLKGFNLRDFKVELILIGLISSLIPFGTIVFTPIFGGIADSKGKRATLMIIGSILLIAVHLTLALTYLPPFIPLAVAGVAFSLVPAAMWPSVPFIVRESRLGTAYGLMFSIQNIGLMLFPWLAGVTLDATNPGVTATAVAEGTARYNYTYTMLMFSALGILGLIFAFLLKREDKKIGNKLERP